jgi:hypothetical protein
MKNLTLLTELSSLFSSDQLNEGALASLSDARLCLDAVNRRVYMARCEFGMVTVRCIQSSKVILISIYSIMIITNIHHILYIYLCIYIGGER